jgi:hypothetical protein
MVMPRCALPDHINEKEEIESAFPDDSQYKGFFGRLWRKWNKATKHIEAWGPRCPKGIAFTYWPPFLLLRKWREFPIVLFAFSGGGPLRWERTDGSKDSAGESQNLIWVTSAHDPEGKQVFLTRVQLWCRWHVQLQWPLFFCFHWYKTDADVIPAGEKADRDGKLWNFYIGAKRDGDCYWYLAFFIGRNWK